MLEGLASKTSCSFVHLKLSFSCQLVAFMAHSFKSQLIGEGSSKQDVRNAIQSLNGIHCLQGHFDENQLHKMMDCAQKWAGEWCDKPFGGESKGDEVFASKWNRGPLIGNCQPVGKKKRW